MSRIKKEIDCLNRLQDLTGQLQDIVDFLRLEGLIDDAAVRHVKQSAEASKEIQFLLRELKIKEKVQMLQYEWTILPIENITITIITDRNQKEFIFNG